METVYHGPVPAPDVALLEGWVRKIVGEAATISKGAFMEAVRWVIFLGGEADYIDRYTCLT